jgi:carboxymethylenebutenolidase
MGKLWVRILKWIVIAVIGFVLLLTGSVLVDYALGSNRIQEVTNTTIPGYNGGPDVRAFVARPVGEGPFPSVIMIHEFYGLNHSIVGKAEGLAEEGYIVIAPDTFRGSTTAWIPRAIFQVITSRPERVNQDLDAVFTWLGAQPDTFSNRIGVMGFCYGGRASLSFSLHNPGVTATVVFYGSPETDPQILRMLPGPVLGIFGGADNSIPLTQVQAFKDGLDQAGIPNEISVYPGQPHAFVTDMESIRAGGVQADAWGQMLSFLDHNLKQGGNSMSKFSTVDYQQPFAFGYYLRLVYTHMFEMDSYSH